MNLGYFPDDLPRRGRSRVGRASDLAKLAPFQIGAVEIRPASREVVRGDRLEILEPRIMQVLVLLATARGEILNRDDLIDACWGGRAVTDDAVNRVMSRLRRLARDFGSFEIETVIKVGYRLVEMPPEPVAGGAFAKRWWAAAIAIGAMAVAAIAVLHFAAPKAPGPARIAVLPFDSSGIDPSLAAGLSDELLSKLAGRPDLRVTGHSSSSAVSGRDESPRAIGRQLGADYLVEGSIHGDGSAIAVTAKLIDTKTADAIWSRRLLARTDQLQSVETALEGGILDKLNGSGAAAPGSRQVNGYAYALYLQAGTLLRQRQSTSLARAEDLLKQAVAVQPDFAAAWANLSIATMLGQVYSSGDPAARSAAQSEARRAVALDSRNANGWAAMALAQELSGAAAESDIDRALALQPRDSQILLWASIIEQNQGDYSQACQHSREAAAIDPLWERSAEAGAECVLMGGLAAEAYGYADRVRSVDPDGAAYIEAQLALEQVDLSKVVAIGLGDPARMSRMDDLRDATAVALIYLGQSNTATALDGLPPIDRAILNHRLPAPEPLLHHVRELSGVPQQSPLFELLFSELGAAGRWSEIVRFYDDGLGPFADIRSGAASAQDRMRFGWVAAMALMRTGRTADALRLQHLSDAAADRLRANGLNLPADIWFELAEMDAAQGRRERALEELPHAYDHSGLGGFTGFPDIATDPYFASIRGDPRFAKARDFVLARLQSERRKVEALGVL